MKSPNVFSKHLAILTLLAMMSPALGQSTGAGDARSTIERFQNAIRDRNLAEVEATVSPRIVVFENGHRNDGWVDFRDNHLKPEFAEPSVDFKTEIVRFEAGKDTAWAYSKSTTTIRAKSGEERDFLLWSVYILSRGPQGWRIDLLDWSVRSTARQ